MKTPFKIYERTLPSGNTGYRVDMGKANGVRKFKSFADRLSAEAFQAQCLQQQAHKQPIVLQELDAVTRHEVLAALELCKANDVKIGVALAFYLKHNRPPKGNITISELVDLWEKSKKDAGLTDKYTSTAKASFFTPFQKHFKNCLIKEITKDACNKYIYGQKTWGQTTKATHLRHLTVLLNYAIEEKYLTLNPIAEVQKPKREKSTAKKRVMTVAGEQALLQFTLNKLNSNAARVAASKNPGSIKHFIDLTPDLASMVLVFFCGVRVEEVERVKWEDIRTEDKVTTVTVEEPKVVTHRRTNKIPGNALAWLNLCRYDKDGNERKGRIAPLDYEQRMKSLRNAYRKWLANEIKEKRLAADVDMDCYQNSARICFASYHIAAFEDPSKTSMLLGHQSPALLWNTYRALVSKTQAKKYWQITPGKVWNKNEEVTHDMAHEAQVNRLPAGD